MDKPQVRALNNTHLADPVFVDLTSYPGSPMQSVAHMLVEQCQAEKVAELYSPYFPDCVVSGISGLCGLPMLEFYASTSALPNLLILSGEQQADLDDVRAFYEVAETAFEYGVQQGCRSFASCAVFRSRRVQDAVYVAATTSEEASALAKKLAAQTFGFGRIISPMGPLLGLAKIHGFRVLSVQGPLKGGPQDQALANILLHHLITALDLRLV